MGRSRPLVRISEEEKTCLAVVCGCTRTGSSFVRDRSKDILNFEGGKRESYNRKSKMSAARGLLANFDKELYADHFYTPYLATIEAKTGIKRTYITYAILGFLSIYLIFGYFAQLVCNLIGFVWPAYQSIKALESSSKDDDTKVRISFLHGKRVKVQSNLEKWLMYWVTFAGFNVVEFFSDKFLDWFPFYWLAKCVFLIWLFFPMEANGSYVLYHKFIRPVFLRNQEKIDETVKRVGKKAVSAATTAYNEMKDE